MLSSEPDAQPSTPSLLTGPSWPATVALGVLTLILGIVVAFHPGGSLNVAAVLFGILMILSGIFHLIRILDPEEVHRVWLGIAGLMFIVVGVVLIRHLHVTLAIVGLLVGITWIVQGLAALVGGISSDAREGRAWWIAFGAISVIAGIVVAQCPRLLPDFPNRPARHLVHRHGPLRDHRRPHAPARAPARGARHGDDAPMTAHPRRVMHG